MLKIGQYRKQLLLVFYLILSILMTFVINTKGIIWGGDDMVYHVGRLISLKSSFQSGVIIPSISASNFGMIGYGINLFYPWVTLVPMVLISLVIHDPITAYYVGLTFFMFVSFCLSHYVMRKFSNSETQAIVFSLIYSLANYRLIDVFSRADIAEYIASVFIPLAFWGFYETFFKDYKKWPVLAAGMSLLLLTHVLTTVIVAFFFIIILVTCWFMASDYRRRLQAVCAAIITSVLASAIFLFPFLSEIFYQKYQQPSPFILKGKDPLKLLYSSLINNADRSIDGNIYNIGIILLIALVLGLFFFKSFNRLYRSIYLLAILSFIMVMQIFPWFVFQKTPLNIIQFPFRFLAITTLLMSVVATKIFVMVFTNSSSIKQTTWAIGILSLVLMGLWTSSVRNALHRDYLTDPGQIVTKTSIKTKGIYEGYFEQYSPAAAQPYMKDIEGHVGYLGQQKLTMELKPNGQYLRLRLNNVKKGTKIDLPVVKYRYSTVSINKQAQPLIKSHRGTITVQTDKNYQTAIINVGYKIGFLAWFSLLVSLLTWIWLLLEIIYKD